LDLYIGIIWNNLFSQTLPVDVDTGATVYELPF